MEVRERENCLVGAVTRDIATVVKVSSAGNDELVFDWRRDGTARELGSRRTGSREEAERGGEAGMG